jgi:hypothetical protein
LIFHIIFSLLNAFQVSSKREIFCVLPHWLSCWIWLIQSVESPSFSHR